MSAREEQIRKALEQDERDRALATMSDEDLSQAYVDGWTRVREATEALEPLHHERIARAVREVVPNATAIGIEATDQGGDGWVLTGVVRLADGTTTHDTDALQDDDDLSTLLSDLGFFMSSEDHPAQDLELQPKEPT